MISRRNLLKSGYGHGGGNGLFSRFGRAFAADVNLRIIYWGSPDRVKRTDAVKRIVRQGQPRHDGKRGGCQRLLAQAQYHDGRRKLARCRAAGAEYAAGLFTAVVY